MHADLTLCLFLRYGRLRIVGNPMSLYQKPVGIHAVGGTGEQCHQILAGSTARLSVSSGSTT